MQYFRRLELILLLALVYWDAAGQDLTRARESLHGLTVQQEYRCSPYDSDDYSYPQSVEPRIVASQGGLFSPYDMQCFQSLRDTDIEHIVARSEAHDSGLCRASVETRKLFASDLDNLALASPSLNRHQKRASDAAEWLPPRNQCWYVYAIVRVKRKYGLSVDHAESDALNRLLWQCAGVPVMVTPSCTLITNATPATPPQRRTDPVSPQRTVGNCGPYANCTALRRDHPRGVSRDHCAYSARMDRDKDGWACER